MLEVVSGILRDYQSAHGLRNVPIKTSLLVPFVEQRGHVDKIYLEKVEVEARNVLARVVKYRGATSTYSGQLDHALIQFPSNQNLCWTRFAVCKEMFHCMIDQQENDRVAKLGDLKKLTELLVADYTTVTGAFAPHEKEQQAELFALETLLPVEHRLALKPKVTDGVLSYLQIAERFKVPEFYTRFSFQPSYLGAMQALRGKLIEL
jgi:Zn-dependent peptidase ImmA (M78 family)